MMGFVRMSIDFEIHANRVGAGLLAMRSNS